MSNRGGPPGNINFTGFSMKKPAGTQKTFALNAVPPPSSLSSGGRTNKGPGLTKHGYSTMDTISQYATSSMTIGKKRATTEDDYFEDDEDTAVPDLAYIPAPGSPSYVSLFTHLQIKRN